MEKVYIDMTECRSCTGIFIKGKDVVQAGTTVCSMPSKDKNDEYRNIADSYDIHFIFDDDTVNIDFYTIPRIDIMATDRQGGYLGTVGGAVDAESRLPVCYIDKDRNTYLIANTFRDFPEKISNWKSELIPYKGIQFFSSVDEAKLKYSFLDISPMDKMNKCE